MSEKCKYCNYVSKCSQFCEYNSVICKLHRSFPKIVSQSYEELLQENQSLKKENKILRENAEHNDKVVDKVNWENQELKKQLEELKSTNKVLSEELTKDRILNQDCLTTCCGIPIGDIPKLINQQKEFIEYLEDEIKNIKIKWGNKLTENGYIDIAMTVRAYQIILQKYKEIIGDKE